MTQSTIKSQVRAINQATEIALKSKKTAIKFLVDAGIMMQSNSKNTTQSKEKR